MALAPQVTKKDLKSWGSTRNDQTLRIVPSSPLSLSQPKTSLGLAILDQEVEVLLPGDLRISGAELK